VASIGRFDKSERRGGADPGSEAPLPGCAECRARPAEPTRARPDRRSPDRDEITRLVLLIRDACFVARSQLTDGPPDATTPATELFAAALRKCCRERDKPPPTARQLEAVQLLALGLSSDDICRRMCVSPHTLNDHFADLCDRAGFADRRELRGWLRGIQGCYLCLPPCMLGE
jgi:DNA-binding CsgD family transcriptional regulator